MKIQEKSWEDWKKKVTVTNGYGVIMCTDCFEVVRYPFEDKYEKMIADGWKDRLLDMRIFDSKKEYRLFRGDIGRTFSEAILDDSLGDYYDDEQYLDIDTKRSVKGEVRATGGGSYTLPFDDFCGMKVKIRNYLGYDENGQAYIKAFRLTGFKKEDSDGIKG